VPQPERDHGAIDAVLKKVHGGGVTKYMGRDVLPFERRASRFGTVRVLGDETLDRIAAESTATDAGKDRVIGQTVAFAQPSIDGPCCFRAERRATLFSAFPEAAHVSAGPQHDVLAVQANQLGNPQTCLDTNQKEGAITTPQPSGRIRNREQRVDLFPVEKLDRASFVAFIGHRQDALAMQRKRGFFQSYVVKEGVDGSEARIPRARAVFAGGFQVVEEKANKRRIEILDAKLGGYFAQSFFGKVQKQAKAIAISCYSMRTRLALAQQAIGKEGLKEGGKVSGNHGRTSGWISRSVTS